MTNIELLLSLMDKGEDLWVVHEATGRITATDSRVVTASPAEIAALAREGRIVQTHYSLPGSFPRVEVYRARKVFKP